MADIAGWVAPIATMLAAMMTAANLGARFTGWGFVVFLIGSIAWMTVAVATGQQNLLFTNVFLSFVNLVGIWRWLGRQAKLDDGARAASKASQEADGPALFPASMLQEHALSGPDGATIGRVAGAMTECGSGRIAYLVVGEGGVAGVGERLHMLPWERIRIKGDTLSADLSAEALTALPEVTPDEWPESARAIRG